MSKRTLPRSIIASRLRGVKIRRSIKFNLFDKCFIRPHLRGLAERASITSLFEGEHFGNLHADSYVIPRKLKHFFLSRRTKLFRLNSPTFYAPLFVNSIINLSSAEKRFDRLTTSSKYFPNHLTAALKKTKKAAKLSFSKSVIKFRSKYFKRLLRL